MSETVKVDAMGGKFDKIQKEKGEKILLRALDWFVKKQKIVIEKLENGEAMGQESNFMQFLISANIPPTTDNVLELSKKFAQRSQNDSDDLISNESSTKTTPIFLAQASNLKSISVSLSHSAAETAILQADAPELEAQDDQHDSNDKPSIPSVSENPSASALSSSIPKKSFKPPAQVAQPVPPAASTPKSKSKGSKPASVTPKSNDDGLKKKRVRKEGAEGDKKKRAKRDPDAPKNGRSAYIIYTSEQREAYTAEHPEEKSTEITAGLATMWNNLTDQEKLPYILMATDEKKLQQRLIQQYVLDNPDSQLATSKTIKKTSKSPKPPAKRRYSKATETAGSNDENDASDEGDACLGRRSERNQKALATAAVLKAAQIDADQSYGEQEHTPSSDSDDDDAGTPQGKRSRSKSINLPPKQVTLKSQKPVVVGVKQNDLDQEEDLLHTPMKPNLKGAFPPDTAAAVGNEVAVILAPYRHFLSTLPHGLLPPHERNLVQQLCNLSKEFVYGTINAIRAPQITQRNMSSTGTDDGNELYDELNLVTLTVSGCVVNIVHVDYTSPLLAGDIFVVPRDTFETSMRAVWLAVGSPIRRWFANESEHADDDSESAAMSLPPDEQIEYLEGIVYYVKPDMMTNPYNSVLVIWTSQEADSLDWVYSFSQTSNECSPWDLEASAFKKHSHKYIPHAFPRSFTVGALSASLILDYLKDHNAASQFTYDVAGVSDEFRAMFPDKKDHLDLGFLSKQALRGRYDGHTGITTLFRDLERMVANSKKFNEANTGFLPWRLSDMMEKTVMQIKALIAKERKIVSLQESIKEELSLQMEMALEHTEEL